MKIKTLIGAVAIATTLSTQAATSIVVRNFTSATVGVPIVSPLGVPVDQGLAFASGGIFAPGVDFGTQTALQIMALFTPLDAVPVALNANFDGLFSGTDLNGAYANGSFATAPAYIVVGNNASQALWTAIAVYNVGSVFPTPDALGNASANYAGTNIDNWVYGVKVPVTVQPAINGAAYTQGISMSPVAIPEPSAALLGAIGALGLLRRRRI